MSIHKPISQQVRVRGMKTTTIVVLLSMMLCSGCIGINGKLMGREFAALREMVFETMREQLRRLADNRSFCCRVLVGGPVYSQRELAYNVAYPRPGVVMPNGKIRPDEDSSYDRLLGETILDSLRKSTIDDAVPFASIRSGMVHTACIAWFGKDGSSLAGIVVITPDDVYFIFTEMYYVTLVEEGCLYEIFWAEPPYYMWRSPYWVPILREQGQISACYHRIIKEVCRAYPDDPDLQDDLCFDNSVIAFRMDIAPENILMTVKGARASIDGGGREGQIRLVVRQDKLGRTY